jgi:hypothetical protein
VVERATARSISLPLPPVADAHLVAIGTGAPLPAQPFSAEPAPTPTPEPAGGDVAGMPVLLSSWVATENGRLVAHARRLVATEGGGVRIAAELPALDLGSAPTPDDRAIGIQLLPRPGSSDILVWISGENASHGVVWDGGSVTQPIVLPADWPANAGEIAWRPDGKAIAASAGESLIDGGFEGFFVVAEIGARRTTRVPITGAYDRLEGWWSATELRVGHVVCTEGCPGRYSYSARLRVADHRLKELTPADRGHQPIDYTDRDGDRIVMTMRNEAPGTNLSIAWPATLGAIGDVDVSEASDGRSLIVTRTVDQATEAYRIDDVVGRAVRGLLDDPRPVRIATVDGRGVRLEFAPGEAWAIAHDRVGDQWLVRLADGRTWPLDRDRDLTWGGSAR